MANKGRGLEALLEYQNWLYKSKGVADIRKVHVNWVPQRAGGQIVGAYPAKKSELDFKGTLAGGRSVSFDCKETSNPRGLPLANIKPHQISYMRNAMVLGEVVFILCEIKPLRQQFVIQPGTVIARWNAWQANKGKRGYGVISIDEMTFVPETTRGPCDYFEVIKYWEEVGL